MFSELFWMSNFPTYQDLMKEKIEIPSNRESDEIYIQYRDQEKNSFRIKKHQEFLELLEE
jgi:hypothetical protein